MTRVSGYLQSQHERAEQIARVQVERLAQRRGKVEEYRRLLVNGAQNIPREREARLAELMSDLQREPAQLTADATLFGELAAAEAAAAGDLETLQVARRKAKELHDSGLAKIQAARVAGEREAERLAADLRRADVACREHQKAQQQLSQKTRRLEIEFGLQESQQCPEA